MIKESVLYEKSDAKSDNQSVQCGICRHRCHIREDESGYCKSRLNRRGKLFSQTYGKVSVWRKSPIEINPVFHFRPGSFALSLGSLGCNFLCPGCQNWDISFALENQLATSQSTQMLTPRDVVELAQKNHCQGISWTYNEPTLWFEYILEGAQEARSAGLYTCLATNGYFTPEALDMLGPHIDIYRVDIKAFSDTAYQQTANIKDWRGILETTQRARQKWNMHVEIVTNLVPGINDDIAQMQDLTRWIKEQLGPDTPWHITRFFPRWKMDSHCATPIPRMVNIRQMALEEGLNYVYLGNLYNHPGSHTYCPQCAKAVIERLEWETVNSNLVSGKCPNCDKPITGNF